MFAKGIKILVIDDTRTIRVLIRDILSNLGYKNVEDVETAEEALQKMKQASADGTPYEFIFCDWNLPGMSGLELLEVRNRDATYSKTPFLMVTIESERDKVLKAVTMGVSDFIVKPFSEVTIKSKMQGIYSRLPK